jgi:hypothetical protein
VQERHSPENFISTGGEHERAAERDCRHGTHNDSVTHTADTCICWHAHHSGTLQMLVIIPSACTLCSSVVSYTVRNASSSAPAVDPFHVPVHIPFFSQLASSRDEECAGRSSSKKFERSRSSSVAPQTLYLPQAFPNVAMYKCLQHDHAKIGQPAGAVRCESYPRRCETLSTALG